MQICCLWLPYVVIALCSNWFTAYCSLCSERFQLRMLHFNIAVNESESSHHYCLHHHFQASDTHSTGKILVAVVKNCFEVKNWDALNENIVLLTKKRGQIKQVGGASHVQDLIPMQWHWHCTEGQMENCRDRKWEGWDRMRKGGEGKVCLHFVSKPW